MRLPWEMPNWEVEVEDWVRETLAREGIELTGPIQRVQQRPWSMILRVPAGERAFYCKFCSPALRHEPALTKALVDWLPGVSLPVIGADPQRGYILTADGGQTLRSWFEAGAPISLWLQILPVFARLQIEMIDHRTELLNLGTIDRHLTSLPDQFAALLSDMPALRIGKKDGLTRLQFEQLSSESIAFKSLCEQLAGFGIPETLEHDDFHDGNIFFANQKPVFFDWGESCLTHPFFSMVVGLNSISYRFNLQQGDAQWDQLRDAYLLPWQAGFERAALLEAFDLAMQLGAVNRALTWHLVIQNLPPRWQRQDADAVPGWLQNYLERRERHSKQPPAA